MVVEVPVSMLMLMILQESEEGTNMCWPVFVPQITGGEGEDENEGHLKLLGGGG